jgi:uncharacterized protein with FMN-binding domain
MKKVMKKVLLALLGVLAVIVLIGAAGMIYLSLGLNAGKKVAVSAVDPSVLSDGTYEGSYSAGRWSNKVAVSIEGGKIADIKILEDILIVQPGLSDEVFGRVIDVQNTTVDAVSGATVSSKAYLKSIEDALTE